MKPKRFSKKVVLDELEKRACRIAEECSFNRNWGTAQLRPKRCSEEETRRLERAVEYGRMLAFEQFSGSIENGFWFDPYANR